MGTLRFAMATGYSTIESGKAQMASKTKYAVLASLAAVAVAIICVLAVVGTSDYNSVPHCHSWWSARRHPSGDIPGGVHCRRARQGDGPPCPPRPHLRHDRLPQECLPGVHAVGCQWLGVPSCLKWQVGSL